MLIVTGSYNGQDSLGDECLLKAVVFRIRKFLPSSQILVQLHDLNAPFIGSFATDFKVEISTGLQTPLWRVEHLMRRLKMPDGFIKWARLHVVRLFAKLNYFQTQQIKANLRATEAFFVYGGTQFSGQWYSLNAPALLESAQLTHNAGGKVIFGPQQYGPLKAHERAELKRFLLKSVDYWVTRNELDIDLLADTEADRDQRLVYDEVFSATELYPSSRGQAPEYFLVNLRSMTFDTNDEINKADFKRIALLIDELIQEYQLPAVFFGVSDSTFCDDASVLDTLKAHLTDPTKISSVGRVKDEYELFELAHKAQFALSMSFHGCILSGIAGCPFIPVTEGKYYDHKYVDFNKYTGNQGVPVVSLSNLQVEKTREQIKRYVSQFDISVVEATRQKASGMLDQFYIRSLPKVT
jgi:polysaccharide pyruvyl transferase WcaK-like protein